MFTTPTYLYTLYLQGQYYTVMSEDSVMEVLSEHPGAQFVSRNIVGYKAVVAD